MKYLYFVVTAANKDGDYSDFLFSRPLSSHFTVDGDELKSPVACYTNKKDALRDANEMPKGRVIRVPTEKIYAAHQIIYMSRRK